jgi:hypothetical protein
VERGVIFEVMIRGKTTMWQLGEYLACVDYLYRVYCTLITHMRQTAVLMREDAAATAVKKRMQLRQLSKRGCGKDNCHKKGQLRQPCNEE